ncbi:hypothetical protein ACH5AL_02590 [Actinacidiphila glaucinigra]|uniref:hypothetical protein n=1 Tax=Actinacidiphila glaucinigra TaxID=235986 RepID=UPI00378CC8E6
MTCGTSAFVVVVVVPGLDRAARTASVDQEWAMRTIQLLWRGPTGIHPTSTSTRPSVSGGTGTSSS